MTNEETIEEMVNRSTDMWINSSMRYRNKEQVLEFGTLRWPGINDIQLVNIAVVNVLPDQTFIPAGRTKRVVRSGSIVIITEGVPRQ